MAGSNFYKRTRLVFLTVVFVICVIPLFFLSLPLYFYRYFVSVLARVLRPDLRKMVNTRGSIFASEDLSNTPVNNLILVMTFEGAFDMEKLYKDVNEKLLWAKDSDGKLLFPEFQEFYYSWLGFNFFKVEPNFKLENHLNYYEPEETMRHKPVSEEEFLKIRTEFDKKPWPPNTSPWLGYIFPNYIENNTSNSFNNQTKKSVLLICIHHGICDGFALIFTLLNKLGQINDKVQSPSNLSKTKKQKFMDAISFPFKAPYQIAEQMSISIEENDLKLPVNKLDLNLNWVPSKKIPISYIKEIKNIHNVSFTAILLAGITGGLRSLMLGRGMKIPKKINLIAPFPMPNHPFLKLRNFFSFVILTLPVGTSDQRQRVKQIEEMIEEKKRSFLPFLNFIAIPFIAAFPAFIIKKITHIPFATGVFSNFPGPTKIATFQGLNLIDLSFTGGTGPGIYGIACSSLSYAGFLRLNLGLSQSFCRSSKMIDELLQFILDELNSLKNSEEVA